MICRIELEILLTKQAFSNMREGFSGKYMKSPHKICSWDSLPKTY